MPSLPSLGVGVGLRRAHFQTLPTTPRRLDFLEIIPENYMDYGGMPWRVLERCLERWPVVVHSVGLNLGGTAPLDASFLDALARVCDRVNAPWVSGHLCFTAVPGLNTHELLPLPFTEEAVWQLVGRIRQVQARLERPFLVENISAYLRWPEAELSEAAFIRAVLEEADCGLLLDVNNVYVNAQNHGEDPWALFDQIPLERVGQLHLAGHHLRDGVIIDTHAAPVCEGVWALYRALLPRLPRHSVLLERDADIPPLDELLDEADRARVMLQEMKLEQEVIHAIG